MTFRYQISLFFVVLLSCLSACQDTTAEAKSKTTKPVVKKVKPTGIKVWIYDFDPEQQQFAYRQANSGVSKGDPIRVAIRYFLDHNHLKGSFAALELVRIGMRNHKAAFLFSGRMELKEEEELATFKMALDSTIRKNNFKNDYSIVINDKVLR